MVVCIFLLAILTVGAASAADENITDTNDGALSAEPVSEDLSSDENVVEKATGDFSQLQSLVDKTDSGKTLYLDSDYTRDNTAILTISIRISKPITIDGQGHTIDANNLGYINIANGRNVTLKNIHFVNSPGALSSASIYKFTVINCSFINCHSLAGGAISCGNAYDCSFVNCSSSSSSKDFGGGAIWKGNAYNCSFIDCYATNSGGAIYRGSAVDCSFRNCSTKDSDAAICGGTATNCTFVDCQAFAAINSIRVADIGYGNPAEIYVFGESNAGYVNVIVNGKTRTVTPYPYGVSVSFSNLAVGTYQVKVTYPGSAGYNAQTVTSTFEVTNSKPISCIYINNPYVSSYGHKDAGNVGYQGKDTTLYITMDNKNVPGYLNVTINGVSQVVKITGSELSVPLGVLNMGSYNLTVNYAGTAAYYAQNMSLAFKIVKGYAISYLWISPEDPYDEADSLIEFKYSESRLHVSLRSTAIPGFITIKVNNLTYVRNITGRSAISLSLGILKPGPYEINVNYAGNDNFEAQNATIWFDVVKSKPVYSINLSPYDFNTYGDSTKQINYDGKFTSLNIYLRNNRIAGNVHITVNGASHKAFTLKGISEILNIPLGILNLGENVIKVTYAGSAYFDAQEVSFNINVLKGTPISSVEVSNWAVDGDPTIKVKVNNVNGNIWFTISDENNTKILTDKIHIENGWAITSIPNLKVGKYYLHIYYAGNVHYSAQTIKSSFEVTKIFPELSVAKTTVDGKTVLTANVPKDAGGNINFEINGSTYKAQITKGSAVVTLPDMAPGTYPLKSSYGGNYKYLPETKTRTITIK
ncbi:hypothetical protein [Methanobrevibacter sp.]